MPHHQGALDGLCGVYSIVNSISIVRAEQGREPKELFDAIIEHLSEKRHLKQIITSGMTIGVLYNIINDLITEEIPRRRPFVGKDVSLPMVWDEMLGHLESPSTGIGAVIIGLNGKHNHWTVVTRIQGDTLFLTDSDGLKRLSRKKITIGEPTSRRIHQIVPNEVVFLG